VAVAGIKLNDRCLTFNIGVFLLLLIMPNANIFLNKNIIGPIDIIVNAD
jgi:hypothetical protein